MQSTWSRLALYWSAVLTCSFFFCDLLFNSSTSCHISNAYHMMCVHRVCCAKYVYQLPGGEEKGDRNLIIFIRKQVEWGILIAVSIETELIALEWVRKSKKGLLRSILLKESTKQVFWRNQEVLFWRNQEVFIQVEFRSFVEKRKRTNWAECRCNGSQAKRAAVEKIKDFSHSVDDANNIA